jgi:hypothetical protein
MESEAQWKSAEERLGPPRADDLLIDAAHHVGVLEPSGATGLLRYRRHDPSGRPGMVADGATCQHFVPRERAVAAVAEVTRERDEARAELARMVAEWSRPREQASAANLSARASARRRVPLDGAEAQAMEGALSSTERERDAARARVAELEAALAAGLEVVETVQLGRKGYAPHRVYADVLFNCERIDRVAEQIRAALGKEGG